MGPRALDSRFTIHGSYEECGALTQLSRFFLFTIYD
jgi:hypothetical protein